MTDKIELAALMRKMARPFERMAEAADAVELIGSIENAEAEARARLEAARAEAVKVEERLKQLYAERFAVEAQNAETIAKAQAEAARILEEAKAAELQSRELAVAHGDSLIETARQSAKEVKEAAAQTVLASFAERDAARLELDEFPQKIAAAQAELALLDGKIAGARKKIEAMLA